METKFLYRHRDIIFLADFGGETHVANRSRQVMERQLASPYLSPDSVSPLVLAGKRDAQTDGLSHFWDYKGNVKPQLML